MAIKLTESRLRKIIKEEVKRLEEITLMNRMKRWSGIGSRANPPKDAVAFTLSIRCEPDQFRFASRVAGDIMKVMERMRWKNQVSVDAEGHMTKNNVIYSSLFIGTEKEATEEFLLHTGDMVRSADKLTDAILEEDELYFTSGITNIYDYGFLKSDPTEAPACKRLQELWYEVSRVLGDASNWSVVKWRTLADEVAWAKAGGHY